MTLPEAHKPKLLFLDDRTKRIHAALKKWSKLYDITLATNVKECLRAMSSEDFDYWSLDHDLNGCDFEDPDGPNTGMEVVRYLEKTDWPDSKPRPVVFVHSSNLFAAHQMVMRLNRLGFRAYYKRFEYEDKGEYMKYDKEGNPL